MLQKQMFIIQKLLKISSEKHTSKLHYNYFDTL